MMKKIQEFFLGMDRKKKIALVVAGVFIMGALIFLADPAKRFMDRRNTQRRSDVFNLLTAIYDYSSENGAILEKVGGDPKEICAAKSDCGDLLDINDLIAQKFIQTIPSDPRIGNAKGTGYVITRSASGRMTVWAPGAEGGVKISATR